jgi:hypothetical protein
MVEVYISTDIESDGPIPGPYSMLSFASAAFSADNTLISTFSANLQTLPGAGEHPKTMDWWKSAAATNKFSQELGKNVTLVDLLKNSMRR